MLLNCFKVQTCVSVSKLHSGPIEDGGALIMANNLTKQILEKFDSLSEQELINVLDNYAKLVKSVDTKNQKYS